MGGVLTAAPVPSPTEVHPTRATPGRRRMSLGAKLAFALVGLVSLILLVNGGLNLWLNYEEAKTAVLRVQQEKAQGAAERVDEFISGIEGQIGWTTRAEWRRVPVEQQRYDFIRLLRQAPAITEVAYIDPSGREQLKVSRLEPDQVGPGRDLSADPRFARAVADKVWFGPVYFRRGSEPYMTVAVAHAGRNPGVTVAEVNLKLVWDVITAIRVGEKGYAFVVTGAGRLIAHPDLSLVLRDTDLSGLPQVARALRLAAAGQARAGAAPTAEMAADAAGNAVLTAHAPIGRVGWIVFVQSPLAEAMAPVYRSLLQTLALLAFGLLLAAVAGTLLARRMVVPIRRLQAGAERLGGGDLSERIAVHTGDEIETLADRFNQMAGRIQDSYETLEAKVDERTRDLHEALRRQTATSEVLGVISRSTADAQPVFEAIVGSAAKLFAPWSANITILEAGLLRFKAAASASREDEELTLRQVASVYPIAFDPKQSPSARAILERRILELLDTGAPDTPEYSSRVGAITGFRSMTFVPLLRDGQGIGTIIMTNRQPGCCLDDKQKELIQTFADQAVIAIENARLFEEVQARTTELSESLKQQTATAEVLQAISRSTFDLEVVLETLVESAAKLCESDIGSITRQKDQVFYRAAMHGFPPDFAAEASRVPVAIDEGTVTGRALKTGQVTHIHDVDADPDYTWREAESAAGFRTLLGVPLLRQGIPIGAFALGRRAVRPYSDRQIELVQTFADQAVIAIENARLFEEVQARTAELSESLEQQTATSKVLEVISSSPGELAPVFEAMLANAIRICDAPFGMLYRVEGDAFQVDSMVGVPPGFADFLREGPIRPGPDTALGRMRVGLQPVAIDDAQKGRAYADRDPLRMATAELGGARSFIAVPMLMDSDLVGAITIYRQEVRPFTGKQIALMTNFASQAVIAIQNVTLLNQLRARTNELQQSLDDLQKAQDRLVQSEKLASLGQLTAGIAHEIKNPLNFVNNFAALSADLIDELNEALTPAALDEKTREEVEELTSLLKGNLAKVVSHGKRADSIVKNMLLHSRGGSGERRPVDVNALVEESVNLAYHGARAERPGFNVNLVRELDPKAGEADLYPQEITRVLLNLVTNGFYAATRRGAEAGPAFEPTLVAATRDLGDKVEIRIRDNGTGISDEVRAKMFEPFFTTKPAGEGTGLGLSLSHDIVVKQHGGTIEVSTEPGAFTEFRVVLPRGGFTTGPRDGP